MAFGKDFERDGWNYKHIAATKLRELLQRLPEGATVICNEVRNLAVCDAAGAQFGHLDIGREEIVLYDPVG